MKVQRPRSDTAAAKSTVWVIALLLAVAMTGGVSYAQESGSADLESNGNTADQVLDLPSVVYPESAATEPSGGVADESGGAANCTADSTGSGETAPQNCSTPDPQNQLAGDGLNAAAAPDGPIGTVQDYEAQQEINDQLASAGSSQMPMMLVAPPLFYVPRAYLMPAPGAPLAVAPSRFPTVPAWMPPSRLPPPAGFCPRSFSRFGGMAHMGFHHR
ncbi:MAG TPA: hypothetical protein VIX12_09355 [Candidatus Binataceae bacterium]